MSLLDLLPTTYDDGTKYRIEHAGRVSQDVFQTVAGFFCAIAGFAFVGRLAVRLTIRRKLYLDDYLLIFGTCGLVAATVIMYRFTHLIFVLNALKYDKSILPTKADLNAIGSAQGINYSLIAMVWTATCCVKLCFLASFKTLISNVSIRITVWYWAAVALSIIQWILGFSVPFIICPSVGNDIITHCTPETPYVKTLALNTFVTCLDFVTDLMIVSIPIWVLRNVRIRLTQKLAIAVFLCLSIGMIIAGILRMSAAYHGGYWDLTWQYLLLYLESCVAITMASVSAFRSVFVEQKRRREQDQLDMHNMAEADLPRRPDNLWGRIGRLRARAKEDAEIEASQATHTSYLPRVRLEGPRMNGLLTLINGHSRQTEVDSSMQSGTWAPSEGTQKDSNRFSRAHEDSASSKFHSSSKRTDDDSWMYTTVNSETSNVV